MIQYKKPSQFSVATIEALKNLFIGSDKTILAKLFRAGTLSLLDDQSVIGAKDMRVGALATRIYAEAPSNVNHIFMEHDGISGMVACDGTMILHAGVGAVDAYDFFSWGGDPANYRKIITFPVIGGIKSIMQFDKTDATERLLLDFRTDDSANPSTIALTTIGAADQQSREYILQTAESGLHNSGALILQKFGGSVFIGNKAIKLHYDGTINWGVSANQGILSYDTGKALIFGGINNDLSFGTNNTFDQLYIKSGGNIGIGTTSPTARLHLPASAAAANTASLKIPSGIVATTPEAGNIEADDLHIYWTRADGTRLQLDNA